MSVLLRLTSALRGRKVGTDRFGNIYFESHRVVPVYGRRRRWVVYAREKEPTTVPPEWHAWLHHTTDAPLPEGKRYPWQEEHRPNLTGTPAAYRPAGHDYVGGTRRVTGADYEAWTPGS
jgi:NADH:ubiquinone oxidoreductase subunit